MDIENKTNNGIQLPKPLPDWTYTRFGDFVFTVSQYVIIAICLLAGMMLLPMYIKATGRSILAYKGLEGAIIL